MLQVQADSQAYYVDILKLLHEVVNRVRTELWPSDWIFHHDNAPAHKVLSLKQFLTQKSITEMEHTPSSLNLSLNDFWLLPKIKSALKGRRFKDIEDKKNMMALEAIPQQEFQKCFQQWQHC
jgi:hypothetical protein